MRLFFYVNGYSEFLKRNSDSHHITTFLVSKIPFEFQKANRFYKLVLLTTTLYYGNLCNSMFLFRHLSTIMSYFELPKLLLFHNPQANKYY